MALNASKTILLEKQYLYVKASKGFQLEGTNIEKIWVNTGYYRFLVDNVAKAHSNNYVNILYDSSDIDFIAYCSDLFMEEIQNSVVTAVENLETYLQQFAQQNHDDIIDLSQGLSGALQILSQNTSNVFDGFHLDGIVMAAEFTINTMSVGQIFGVYFEDNSSVNPTKPYKFLVIDPFGNAKVFTNTISVSDNGLYIFVRLA